MRTYVVAGPVDPLDGDRLFWANDQGWVDYASADVFPDMSGNLPIEGFWCCDHERHGTPCPQPCNVCDDECKEDR